MKTTTPPANTFPLANTRTSRWRKSAACCLILISLSACVGPDGRPVGGNFNNQGKIVGTVGGALAGWGLSRALDADKNAQLFSTVLGGGIGSVIGNWIGDTIQSGYDARSQREFILDRQIATADNRINAVKNANSSLNYTIQNLNSRSNATTRQKAIVQLEAARRLAHEVDATQVAIRKTRQQAVNQGMGNRVVALRTKESQLAEQNNKLKDTIRQLERKESTLAIGGQP
jgi:uncharacterized membrane protein YeaQ/YmgE (transglycosylase-associated protein family)